MTAKARAKASRLIAVEMLARVEGEGGLHVKVKNGRVEDARLDIFEPPRFFEAFLRGRRFDEAPDITARICGICPVAYQMSACHAMENALGVRVSGPLRELRRLLYCGEWIESHVLHVAMLHAPDFLGYESAIHMAKDHPEVVESALALKKLGNDLMIAVGGREIHPVNVKVGGFHRVPRRAELLPFVERLERARAAMLGLCRLVSTFEFPAFEFDYELVALWNPDEYPLCEGRLRSTGGLDIANSEWETRFREEHVAHSNALHAQFEGVGNYHVGPLARYALNFDRLPEIAQDAARTAGLGKLVKNPFQSIVVRCVEALFALEEALRIIRAYEPPAAPAIALEPKAGSGGAATEAPRGLLFHRYTLDARGDIVSCRIVPPTAQNLRTIEDDLRRFVEANLALPHDRLQWKCEQAVRNYDPCISCATHFLRLTIDACGR